MTQKKSDRSKALRDLAAFLETLTEDLYRVGVVYDADIAKLGKIHEALHEYADAIEGEHGA
jgi:hypothetical protein